MAGRPTRPALHDVQAIEDLMDALGAKASPALQATISQLRADVRSGKLGNLLREWTGKKARPAARIGVPPRKEERS